MGEIILYDYFGNKIEELKVIGIERGRIRNQMTIKADNAKHKMYEFQELFDLTLSIQREFFDRIEEILKEKGKIILIGRIIEGNIIGIYGMVNPEMYK